MTALRPFIPPFPRSQEQIPRCAQNDETSSNNKRAEGGGFASSFRSLPLKGPRHSERSEESPKGSPHPCVDASPIRNSKTTPHRHCERSEAIQKQARTARITAAAFTIFTLLFSTLFLPSCQGSKKVAEAPSPLPLKMERRTTPTAGPPTVVYRTTKDFDNHVPVIMNSAKTEILSYPDPADVGEFSKPTHLKNGYLLDNRGINENAVFLRYTYVGYSRLPQAPSLAVLKASILERYPLKELIYCGSRYQYTNIEEELNALIDANFPGCRRALGN